MKTDVRREEKGMAMSKAIFVILALAFTIFAINLSAAPAAAQSVNSLEEGPSSECLEDDQQVTLEASDLPLENACGVAATFFCIDDTDTCTPTTLYTGPFVIEGPTTLFVRFFSVDNIQENTEPIQSIRVEIRSGIFFVDSDGDGFGSAAIVNACQQPEGTSTTDNDCNDNNPDVNPTATEICDGVDNDCDGSRDENPEELCGNGIACDGAEVCGGFAGCLPGEPVNCAALAGQCVGATGQVYTDVCQEPEGTCGTTAAPAEICDGRDNDCDGLIDEDFPDLNTACSSGLGACLRTGVKVCSEDQLSTVCNAVPGEPSPEVCNNIDDNCDGFTDNEFEEEANYTLSRVCYTGPSGTLGVGVCQTGLQFCQPPAAAEGCTPAPSGMISWWPGEGNANDVQDGNHGTLQNGAGYAAAKVAQGFNLDGLDDFVLVPSAGNLGGMSRLTIDAWVRFDRPPQGGFGEFIVSSPGYLIARDTIALRGVVSVGGGVIEVTAPPINDNNFHHIALVYIAGLAGDNSVLQLYVDGSVVGTRNTPTTGVISTAAGPLGIGRGPGTAGSALDGVIDEVEIFNGVLLQSEIQAIYNAGPAGKCRLTSGFGGACVGEVTPQTEICDTLDNNCNAVTDESDVLGPNTTSVPLFGTLGQNDYYISQVNVTFNAIDLPLEPELAACGLKETRFCIDSTGECTPNVVWNGLPGASGTNARLFSEQSHKFIRVRSVDNKSAAFGGPNLETPIKTIGPINLDLFNPVLTNNPIPEFTRERWVVLSGTFQDTVFGSPIDSFNVNGREIGLGAPRVTPDPFIFNKYSYNFNTSQVLSPLDNGTNFIFERVVDQAGRTTEVVKQIVVDVTPPTTLNAPVTQAVSHDVTVALTCQDSGTDGPASGCAANQPTYCLSSTGPCTPDTPFTDNFVISQEGVTNICWQSRDNVGNLEALRCAEVNIDRAPPIIESVEITPDIVGNASISTPQFTITKRVSDVGTGVSSVTAEVTGLSGPDRVFIGQISLTLVEGDAFNGTWTGVFTFPASSPDLTYEIADFALDRAGNSASRNDASVILDRTPSLLTITSIVPNFQRPTQTVTVTTEALDSTSGISSMEARDATIGELFAAMTQIGGSTAAGQTSTWQRIITAELPEGVHNVEVLGRDRAQPANQRLIPGTFVVDAQAPETTATASFAFSNITRTYLFGSFASAAVVNVALDCTDFGGPPASGCEETQFCVSQTGACTPVEEAEGSGIGTSADITEEGTNTVCFFSRDIAGNEETIDEDNCVTVLIDRTPPVITNDPVPRVVPFETSSITVTGTVVDELSGVDALRISGNEATLGVGGSYSESVALAEGANSITEIANDVAGNVATNIKEVDFGAITGCFNLTLPGTYSLANNLTGVQSGRNMCIDIQVANIVLDCGGLSLAHDGTAGTYAILADGEDNVEIRNCVAAGYGSGIGLLNGADNAIVTQNSLLGNAIGVELEGSNGEVTANTINVDPGIFGIGIQLTGASSNDVNDNVLFNKETGIVVKSNSNGNNILRNTLDGFNGADIQNSNNNVVEDNVMNGRFSSFGIRLTSSSGTTVNANTLELNSLGVVLEGSGTNTITNNGVTGSASAIMLNESSNNNQVSGNTLQGNAIGVDVLESTGNTVVNNFVNAFLGTSGIGVRLTDSSNNDVLDNDMLNKEIAVHLVSSTGNNVSANNMTVDPALGEAAGGTAIMLEAASNGNTVFANTYLRGVAGIIVNSSSSNRIEANVITSDELPIGLGIQLLSATNNDLIENVIASKNNGIILEASNTNALAGNNLDSNVVNGILLSSSTGNSLTSNVAGGSDAGIRLISGSNVNTLADNLARANAFGIILSSGTGNILTDNNASSNSVGIRLTDSDDNELTSNIAENNVQEGILLEQASDGNSVESNSVLGNAFGISMDSSTGNTLTGNVANGNEIGYNLQSASSNSFSDNGANSNIIAGVALDGASSGNDFSGNTFTDNGAGIRLDSADSNTFSNDVSQLNVNWEFYSENAALDNEVVNLEIGSVVIDFYSKDVAIKNGTNPGGLGVFYKDLGKFILATNNSDDSFLDLNVTYTDAERIAAGIAGEEGLRIAKFNVTWFVESDAFSAPGSFGVDAVNNEVFANIVDFSSPPPAATFAPIAPACSNITTPGVTLLVSDLLGTQPGRNVCMDIQVDNVILDCAGFTITNDGTFNAIAVLAASVDNVQIVNCELSGYAKGISLDGGTTNSIVANNALSGNDNGIVVEGSSSGNDVHDNIAESGSAGILLSSGATGNFVRSNTAINNVDGIVLEGEANGNTIIENVVNPNSATGIAIRGANSNRVIRHTITGVPTAIEISGASSANSVVDNEIVSNNLGISVSGTSNIIFNNNFNNNAVQAQASGINEFNNSYGALLDPRPSGNWWSDYTTPVQGCEDFNNSAGQSVYGGDGICDSARGISGSNADVLPWACENAFDVSRETRTPDSYSFITPDVPENVWHLNDPTVTIVGGNACYAPTVHWIVYRELSTDAEATATAATDVLITTDGINVVEFWATIDGLEGAHTNRTVLLDKVAPVTTKTLNDGDGDGVIDSATLTCTDKQPGSGCFNITWTITSSTIASPITSGFECPSTTSCSTTVELPGGDTTISFFSTDVAGNVEVPTTQDHEVDVCPTIPGFSAPTEYVLDVQNFESTASGITVARVFAGNTEVFPDTDGKYHIPLQNLDGSYIIDNTNFNTLPKGVWVVDRRGGAQATGFGVAHSGGDDDDRRKSNLEGAGEILVGQKGDGTGSGTYVYYKTLATLDGSVLVRNYASNKFEKQGDGLAVKGNIGQDEFTLTVVDGTSTILAETSVRPKSDYMKINYFDLQGCPVGDLTKAKMHIVDQRKSGQQPLDGCGIDSKGKPKSACTAPLPEMEVKVFDRDDPTFVSTFTSRPQKNFYDDIFESDIGLLGSCITAANGQCLAPEPKGGKLLVIGKFNDTVNNIIIYQARHKNFKIKDCRDEDDDDDDCDEEEKDDDDNGGSTINADVIKSKSLRIVKIIKKDGSVKYEAGNRQIIIGSKLTVDAADYVIWQNSEELYPFVFNSEENWTIDVCMTVPEGYSVAGILDIDGNVITTDQCIQTIIAGEESVVLFRVMDVGSPEPEFTYSLTATSPEGTTTTIEPQIGGIRARNEPQIEAATDQKIQQAVEQRAREVSVQPKALIPILGEPRPIPIEQSGLTALLVLIALAIIALGLRERKEHKRHGGHKYRNQPEI